MRTLFLTTLVGVTAFAVAASAQPSSSSPPPGTPQATLCLDQLGVSHAPICHKQSASRFPAPPDICLCNGPYREVKAPYCAPGEKEPNDTAAFDRARAKAAEDGSLFGDTYKGQKMCVELRN